MAVLILQQQTTHRPTKLKFAFYKECIYTFYKKFYIGPYKESICQPLLLEKQEQEELRLHYFRQEE